MFEKKPSSQDAIKNCSLARPMLSKLIEQAHAAAALRSALRQAPRSDRVYSHRLNPNFCYTEGFRHFLLNAGGGAYWLADLLALEPQIARGVAQHGLLVAALNVDCGTASLAVAVDRTGRQAYRDVIHSQHIGATDCPPGEWLFNLGPAVVGNREVVMACRLSEN